MTSAPNSGNYVDFDEYVGLKLEKTRSTIRTTDLLTTLAGVASMFLGYLLVFVILDQWAVADGFSPLWRWILLSVLVISTIAWLILKVGIPSFKTVNGLFAAKEIEDAEPDLKGNLLNLVDLKSAGRPINPTILKALERQTALRLQKINIDQAVDHQPLIRTAYLLLAIITVFCIYAMLSPKKISNSIWRGLFPGARVAAATVTEIVGDVRPGDLRIPAHQPSVEIQVDVAGKTPEKVQVVYSTLDGKQDQEVELRAEEEGRYRGQLLGDGPQGLINDVKYFVRAGDAKSRVYTITVEQPPYAEVETVRLEAPGYMKFPPTDQVNNPAIDAWEGTRAIVTAKTNMPVSSAAIQFLDDPLAGPTGEEVPMSVSSGGRQVQGAWTLAIRSDGTTPKYYRIHCKTSDDRSTTGHVNFPLLIKPDQPPEVAVVQPDRDVTIPMNSTLSLLIQARDPDFELGYIYLNVEKDGRRVGRDQLSEGRQQKISLRHDVAVARWNPAVGDTYEIWIEAYDNKQPRPNTRNTPKLKVKIVEPVSAKEAEQQLADQKEKIDQQVAKSSPDLNQDQRESDAPRDKDQDRHPDPNKQDVNQNEVAQQDDSNQPQSDAKQAGQKEKAGRGKSGSERGQQQAGNAKSSDNSQDGDSKSEGEQGDKQGKQEKPLRNDGSQDFDALKRISDTLKKRENPADSSSEPPRSDGDSSPKQGRDEQQKQPANADRKNEQENQPQSGKPSEQEKGSGSEDKRSEPSDRPNSSQDKPAGETSPSGAEQKSDQPKSDRDGKGQKREGKTQEGESQQVPKSNPTEENANSGDAESGNAKEASKSGSESKDQPIPSDQKNEAGVEKDQAADNQNTDSKPAADSKPGDSPSVVDEGKEDSKSERSDEKGKSSDKKMTDKESREPSASDDGDPKDSKEQVPESGDSKKGEADGSEKGVAKPDRDPNAKSKSMKNDNVTRDPNEKPALRPSDSQQGAEPDAKNDAQSNEQARKSSSENGQRKSSSKSEMKKGGAQAKEAKSSKASEPNSDGDNDQPSNSEAAESSDDPTGNKKEQPSEQSPKNSDAKSGSNSDKNSDKKDKGSSKDSQDAKSEKGDDQQSSEDSSTPSEESSDGKSGAKGESEKADGEKSSKKGSESGSKSSDGKSASPQKGGDEKGGEQSGGGQAEQQGQSPAPSNGEGEGGQSTSPKAGSQKPGSSKPSGNSSKSGEPGKKAGPNNGNSAGENEPEPDNAPSNQGDAAGPANGDEANLEFNRQATELVLEKLQKELDRGDVDETLLRQLGWSEADLKRFASRMSKSLQESKKPDDTPASKARQLQFEEMLKNLDLKGTGSSRSGENEPKRDVQQIESKRTPPPVGYKSAFEKMTRDLNRQTQPKSKPSAK